MVQQWSIPVKCKLNCRMHKEKSLTWRLYDRVYVARGVATLLGNWIFLWMNQLHRHCNYLWAENSGQVNISINRNKIILTEWLGKRNQEDIGSLNADSTDSVVLFKDSKTAGRISRQIKSDKISNKTCMDQNMFSQQHKLLGITWNAKV